MHILIDKTSNLTVAAGIVKHDLRRATNVKWQDTEITRQKREKILNQKAFVVWFTGLSGSGKSTIANMLENISFSFLSIFIDSSMLIKGLSEYQGVLGEFIIILSPPSAETGIKLTSSNSTSDSTFFL